MTNKPWPETTAFEKWTPKIFGGIIALFFIIMGLISKPKGSEILWEKLHPFGLFDFIGVAGFLFGIIVLSGWLKPLYTPAQSAKWNSISFVVIGLSIILFWFL
jgi:hypothetical protein